jgi:hypothetical protein
MFNPNVCIEKTFIAIPNWYVEMEITHPTLIQTNIGQGQGFQLGLG